MGTPNTAVLPERPIVETYMLNPRRKHKGAMGGGLETSVSAAILSILQRNMA
jgi:hypothetical protein